MTVLCPGCHEVEFDFDPEAGVIACPRCSQIVARQSRRFDRAANANFVKQESMMARENWKKHKKRLKKERKKGRVHPIERDVDV